MKTLIISLSFIAILLACKKKEEVKNPNKIPTILLDSIGGIQGNKAIAYANISNEGSALVSAAGIAIGKNPNPTVFDRNVPSTGFGLGKFSLEIPDLEPSTQYFVRAYAVNAVGTAYSNQITFTSLAQPPPPTIRISSTDPAMVSGEIIANAGEIVDITLVSEAQAGIKRLNGTQRSGSAEAQLPGFPISSFSGDRKSDARVVEYTVPTTATGELIIRFVVRDENDVEASVSVTIRVISTINIFTAVLLNNQSSTPPSNAFYDVINNIRYTIEQAKLNSVNVHIIHALRSASNGGRKLFAPNSADATAIYGSDLANPNRIQTWFIRNVTKFKSIPLSETEFNSINDVASLKTATGAADTYTADNIDNLVTGSTFGVYLQNGKFAIGRITATTGPDAFVPGGANEGSVTVTFKVEK